MHVGLFTCQNGEERSTQILRHTNRIDAEHLKLPSPEYMTASERECERRTFLAGSDAGFRHGAGPPVGKVRLDHASLSAIPLCIFLYLLKKAEVEEEVSGGGKEDIESHPRCLRDNSVRSGFVSFIQLSAALREPEVDQVHLQTYAFNTTHMLMRTSSDSFSLCPWRSYSHCLCLQGDLHPDSFPATFLQLSVHTLIHRRE